MRKKLKILYLFNISETLKAASDTIMELRDKDVVNHGNDMASVSYLFLVLWTADSANTLSQAIIVMQMSCDIQRTAINI